MPVDKYEDFEIEDSDFEEDEVLITYDITTYPSDFTLSGIFEKWNNDEIEIPEFQREFVWSIKQSSLLIESFLLGLPVPPVFFYIDRDNKNLVIDGQQRILSVIFYFEGYFGSESIHGKRQVFRLKGLDQKSPYHEKRFEDLKDSEQRKLTNSVLRAINVRQLSPEKDNTSIYHIFERLNTGGTPLKPQEIRNCVFRGEFASLLKELNKDSNWRSILGKKAFDKHQKDVEFILRIFSLSNNRDRYEKPMKEFLNRSMHKHQKGSSEKVRKFKEIFPITCQKIVKFLGHKPFHLRGPINTSALDSIFCTIMDNLEKIPDDISKRYIRLKEDPKFLEYTTIGTTDTKTLKDRFSLVKSILIS